MNRGGSGRGRGGRGEGVGGGGGGREVQGNTYCEFPHIYRSDNYYSFRIKFS